ncbi:MAG TPA: sigma-70 family RNA polymerase sigma factor [Bryobacteraceae bacterium]|jgi:RNA polymerase sigma-70 factor (ECF subfamily)|nr:sigma-70 family RNA polymerase sigma factor [Bryobacteraceae bacterium]
MQRQNFQQRAKRWYSVATSVDYQGLGTEALVRACVEKHDPAAWEEFIRRYHAVIGNSVLRHVRQWHAASPELVDDLIQETLLKLCKDRCAILRGFKLESENSIYAFLKVVSANVVRDHFKREMAARHGGLSQTCSTDEFPIAQSGTDADLHRRILIGEIESHLDQCVSGETGDRDKQIFWFYFRHGFTAEAIAALPGIGLQVKGVESTIHRLARQLRTKLATRPIAKGKQTSSSL